jgi:hypothetical protein
LPLVIGHQKCDKLCCRLKAISFRIPSFLLREVGGRGCRVVERGKGPGEAGRVLKAAVGGTESKREKMLFKSLKLKTKLWLTFSLQVSLSCEKAGAITKLHIAIRKTHQFDGSAAMWRCNSGSPLNSDGGAKVKTS